MAVEFLESLKAQWMAMIDAIDDPLVILDKDYRILRQNMAYVRLAQCAEGRGVRDFRGEICYKVFAGRSTPCPDCKLKDLWEKPQTLTWQTRELFHNRVFVVSAHYKDASSETVVVHYRDITEQLLIQEKLAHADKLAALGKLASGIAHEINSPLAGILAFAQMVLKEMPEDDPHRVDILEIEDAARKCKHIVESLLHFARFDTSAENTPVNPLDAVRSSLNLSRPMLQKNNIQLVTLNLDLQVKTLANLVKLSQVFLNLITNAIHAMKDGGGVLTISAEIENNMVCISFRDTGTGIEPENMRRIFDPFFTTKPVGEGTGLGLSIAYSIIQQYGGEIRVESVPGLGASFWVYLPIYEESPSLQGHT